jgi:hypothetical protein
MDNFSPELRIFGNGDQLVVAFDSLSRIDAKRAARSIQIPANFKQLSFSLEGFDKDSVTDVGDRRTVIGKINLVTINAGGETTTHELADCQFTLPAIGKPKNGVFQFAPVEQVEYAVRQGVSDALVAALSDFYAARPASDHAVAGHQLIVAPTRSGLDAAETSRQRVAENDERKAFRRKMALAIIGTPLLIWFLAWGGSKLLTPSSPIEDAVVRAMEQDPSSVASQVELTKQTLKQMGLDPGQSGDIGCLAPQ